MLFQAMEVKETGTPGKTCVKNQWIKDRLGMGKATGFSGFLSSSERGGFGPNVVDE
jgi:hypothetical protein